jgi:glutathione S-transferase
MNDFAGENAEERDKARRILLAMNDCIEKAIDAYHPVNENRSYEK